MGKLKKMIVPVAAFALGSGLAYAYFSKYKADDQTKYVTKVTELTANPVDVKEVNIEEALRTEEAFVMVDMKIDGREWKMPISSSEYLKFKVQEHHPEWLAEYSSFVTYNDATLKEIADKVTQNAKTKEEAAAILLELVHQNIYDTTAESAEGNYVKFPLETLVERCGDCEDFVILGAALMKSKGIDVTIVYIPGENGNAEHMALGVSGNFKGYFYEHEGKKYFYAETTGTDWLSSPARWKIGDMPKEYKDKKVELLVVE